MLLILLEEEVLVRIIRTVKMVIFSQFVGA